MAANEKPVYATEWTSCGGKLFKPGDRMDQKVSNPTFLRNAMGDGVATDSDNAARSAREREHERQLDVDRQIATRSEKRDTPRGDIPNLVRLPDGTYARAE